MVETMTALPDELYIDGLLPFTTLHKFSLLLESHMLDGLLATIASPVVGNNVHTSIARPASVRKFSSIKGNDY